MVCVPHPYPRAAPVSFEGPHRQSGVDLAVGARAITQTPCRHQVVSKLPATDIPQARYMAPLTTDDLRRRHGADVETGVGGRVCADTSGDETRPVRHLVIFRAPVVGAARVATAG
jgi:hypothetical protein